MDTRIDNDPAYLLARIGEGDRDAEAQLYRRYARGLRFFLVRRCRDDVSLAEDLLQETFITAIEKAREGQITSADALSSFLHSVASSKATAHYRKEIRRGDVADDGYSEQMEYAGMGPFQRLAKDQIQELVMRLVDSLEIPRDREILHHYYYQRNEKQSVCNKLDLTGPQFDRILCRAKQRLVRLAQEVTQTELSGTGKQGSAKQESGRL